MKTSLTAFVAAASLIASGCGSDSAPVKPARNYADQDARKSEDEKDIEIEIDSSESESGKDSGKDQKDEKLDDVGTSSESSVVLPAPEQQTTATEYEKPEETKKEEPKEPEPRKLEAMVTTTVKKDKKSVKAFVQVLDEPSRELLWPNDKDATASNEGICVKGAVTEIAFRLYSNDKGDIFPGTEVLGVLETAPDSIVFGYEEDGCDEELCQNDNIIRLSCPGGIKLKPAK